MRRKKISKRKKPSNLKILFRAFAIVLIWHGVWGLLEKYFIPENKTLGYIISAVIGLFILFSDDGNVDELEW